MEALAMTIANQAVRGQHTFDVENPATGETIGTAPDCTPKQLDNAMTAAHDAWRAWRTEEAARREALRACGEALVANAEELGDLIAAEQGKPVAQARGEVVFGAGWFSYYAELPLPCETVQDDARAHVEVRRESVGPVAAIVPWNFPVGSACMKIAPALLAGSTMVLKPSPFTPLSMLRAGELLRPLLPSGVLNVVSGGDRLGMLMAEHPAVAKVSLTGSTAAGRSVAESAASDFKRVTLELGGNDPAFVLEDADVDTVADALVEIGFHNCGQVCNAPKRVYAHEAVHDALVAALAQRVEALRVGDPADPRTDLGPLATRPQLERVTALVEEARGAGAVVAAGGAPLDGPGSFYAPTVLRDVRPGMRVVDEEQFGPVMPVLAFSQLEHAIAEANDTRYGLGASVWTRDAERAEQAARLLEAGSVWINSHAVLQPHIPMAGVKWSGVGVEHGPWGLESYLELKVVARCATPLPW